MCGLPRAHWRMIFSCLVLLVGSSAQAQTELLMDGSFRVRGRTYDNLALQRDPDSDTGSIGYFDQRLRLAPELRVNEYLSVYGHFDVLPELVWGTDPERLEFSSERLAPVGQSQAFGQSPGVPFFYPRRVWAEVYAPFGRFKIGRSGMQVGSGMYFNDGNAEDADFGDTADRLQFLTRFGSVYALLGYDMIYEGYQDRPLDAYGVAGAVAYRSELISGSFYVYYQNDRSRPDEGTSVAVEDSELPASLSMDVWNFDLWGRTALGSLNLEFEGLIRYGQGDWVLESTSEADIAVYEDASVFQYGGIARAAWNQGRLRLGIETGLASGDEDAEDGRFTALTFDRDYHIGFLLFRSCMPRRDLTAADESLSAVCDEAVVSNAVTNAYYLAPSLGAKLPGDIGVRLTGLAAWNLVTSAELNQARDYGYEIDLQLSSRFFDRLSLVGTGALFLPGAVFGEQRDFALGGELRAVIKF